MTIKNFPALEMGPDDAVFATVGNTRIFPSPNDRVQQRIKLGQALWKATLSFGMLDEDDRRQLEVFFDSLDGAFGVFYLSPYSVGYARAGAGGGSPIVSGAGQLGQSLLTSGWPNSTTVLRQGDFFSFVANGRTELKRVAADVVSSGGGVATLTFKPDIRHSPLDGAEIETDAPVAIMALRSDDHGGVPISGMWAKSSLDVSEAYWEQVS